MRALRPSARLLFPLLAASALVSLRCGENDSGAPVDPYGSYTNLEDLYIAGFYSYFPAGGPAGVSTKAYVVVRENGPNGSDMPDLEVVLGGSTLTFDDTEEAYVGTPPAVVSGESISLSVGNGTESLSRSVRVPYAPFNLKIRKVGWDISSPQETNTLVWTNPAATGERIAVVLYGTTGGRSYQVYRAETDLPDATMFRIYNREIPYYETYARIAAVVCHENEAEFEANPSGSSLTALAGVSGDWPTIRDP